MSELPQPMETKYSKYRMRLPRCLFSFFRYYDPLFTLHNPLKSGEYSTHNKKMLTRGDIVTDHTYCIVDPLTDQPSHQCVNRGNGDCIQPTAVSEVYPVFIMR